MFDHILEHAIDQESIAFIDHPQVVNGASEVLRDVFGEEHGIGVRLAYGIASLPLNSPVEVELLLEVD